MGWETVSTFLTTRAAGSLGNAALALLLAGGLWWLRRIVSRRLRSSESESLKRQAAIRFLDDIRVVVPLMIVLGGVYLALANLSLWAADDRRPAVWLGAVVLGLALIAVVRMARSFVSVFTEQLEQRLQTPEQLRVLQSIVPQVQRACTGAIVVVGALVILEQVGVPVAPLLAGLGIGGIAVAFAAQNTLANLLAGLSIFIDGTVRVGDMVELDGGQRGFVEDVGWRTTKLRLFANNLLIIPNGKLAESIMTNYQMPNDEVAVYVRNGVCLRQRSAAGRAGHAGGGQPAGARYARGSDRLRADHALHCVCRFQHQLRRYHAGQGLADEPPAPAPLRQGGQAAL